MGGELLQGLFVCIATADDGDIRMLHLLCQSGGRQGLVQRYHNISAGQYTKEADQPVIAVGSDQGNMFAPGGQPGEKSCTAQYILQELSICNVAHLEPVI